MDILVDRLRDGSGFSLGLARILGLAVIVLSMDVLIFESRVHAGETETAKAKSGHAYSENREACAARDPLRRAFWGELHIHSALSFDASMWDVRGSADDVYRFAKGEQIGLAPYGPDGKPLRFAQLERPLDFAALTDHASYQGEVALCTRKGSARYEAEGCKIFRGETGGSGGEAAGFVARAGAITSSLDPRSEVPVRSSELCGDDNKLCLEAMATVWREQQAAASRHYDRTSACSFTTFNAYEYTATPGLAKVHHNVIFRNDNVPASPTAWVDYPDVYELWGRLNEQCLQAGTGCDVLTVPHNSNLSNGRMFTVTGRELPLETQRARARLRAELEILVEISQVKGDSECRNDMYGVVSDPDEFCAFEEWRPPTAPDCVEGTGSGALAGQGCVSRLDYVRNVLVEGFREQERIGVNPYKLGIIAATDNHNATPGDVEEYSYQGWHGVEDATVAQRLSTDSAVVAAISNVISSPGGLAGIWAEENSRDSLFDAMEKREVFGTSGPRMTARFFGGWDYPANLCKSSDLVEEGYAQGVPMGSDLPPRPKGAAAPSFVVSALRDPGIPGQPGGLLQRAQVIKGWLGDDGQFHQKVYDVAGGANEASVDLDTCAPKGAGADSLCSVWSDPDFDPGRNASYYVRVIENPSCRWTQRQCIALPPDSRPEVCTKPVVPQTIQERLWSSPIWYDPSAHSKEEG
ncbi:MAG: DUF3604 domain-containing protein [Myxococcota bacterium]|nr:DUF3604 domain-containing protein [Myxococcota bacterium]